MMTRTSDSSFCPHQNHQYSTLTTNIPTDIVFNFSFECPPQYEANVRFMLIGNVAAFETTQQVVGNNVRFNVSAPYLSEEELKALVPSWCYFHNGVL